MNRSRTAALLLCLATWLGGCAVSQGGGERDKPASDERPLNQRTDAELTQMMLRARGGDAQPSAPPSNAEPPEEPQSAAPTERKGPIAPKVTTSDVPADTHGNEPVSPATARKPPQSRVELKSYISRLRASPESAGDAFRELWEVEADLIPDLILEVENRAASQLRELKIFVADREKFAREHLRFDEKSDQFLYDLVGMGKLEYDSIASGPTRGGKGLKIVVKRFEKSAAFTVGETLRAALLNRFRSSDYPTGDHGTDLVAWWQRFYQKVRSEL